MRAHVCEGERAGKEGNATESLQYKGQHLLFFCTVSAVCNAFLEWMTMDSIFFFFLLKNEYLIWYSNFATVSVGQLGQPERAMLTLLARMMKWLWLPCCKVAVIPTLTHGNTAYSQEQRRKAVKQKPWMNWRTSLTQTFRAKFSAHCHRNSRDCWL